MTRPKAQAHPVQRPTVRLSARAARAAVAALAWATLAAVPAARAQDLTLPPSGDNQVASVTQGIGLVRVTIDYSSPDVHGPGGEDRSGKIWGGLVPYGLHDLGFNDCKQCPWRAGANENTVFTVSHDVQVEGRPLPAGSYGLHMIADPAEWTIIFSRNSTAWGSYSYDPAEDALRVRVKPSECEYNEWLTYEFVDRKPDRATVALKWDRLMVPITITVPDPTGLYLANVNRELKGQKGLQWTNLEAAAQFALTSKRELKAGLGWAQAAVNKPGVGQKNWNTLTTLARLQYANDLDAEARKSIDEAVALGGLEPRQVHSLGRQLQLQGEKEEAMRVYQMNAKRFPGQWPVDFGLARGYADQGETKKAITHAKKALAVAPDEPNRRNLENFIKQLETPKAN